MTAPITDWSHLGVMAGLTDEQRASLLRLARARDFASGAVLFREGDKARELHLVQQGNVAIEVAAPGLGSRRLLSLGPGDLAGWSPLLGEEVFSATARALTAVRTLCLDGREVLNLCNTSPELGYALMRQLAAALVRRVTAARLQLLNLYGKEMPAADSACEVNP